MRSFNYAKLTGKIIEVFGSQKEYARFMGLAERTVSEKLNNHAGFKQEEILRTVEGLGLELHDIPAYFFAKKTQ